MQDIQNIQGIQDIQDMQDIQDVQDVQDRCLHSSGLFRAGCFLTGRNVAMLWKSRTALERPQGLLEQLSQTSTFVAIVKPYERMATFYPCVVYKCLRNMDGFTFLITTLIWWRAFWRIHAFIPLLKHTWKAEKNLGQRYLREQPSSVNCKPSLIKWIR